MNEHNLPQTTLYNWAAGKSLPSGKYNFMWSVFSQDGRAPQKPQTKKPVLVDDES